ncbi:hypothetical protein SAMN04489721_2249 [Agromyces flavus]|uniref:Prenyltransferase and squalene oxidase repeat-containing protein n=2 Tax=Agromyces flavus TaxID=589382 RepID=A0A1H1WI31_9MICO|nr:hypothetical protein SAMN04489721_2249 [Agromyces flavus]
MGRMDVIDWMLDADPAIRWQVRRDVLGESDQQVAADRDRVATEGVGARILALQSDDGYWNGHEYGEDGDRRSVIWSLSLLRRLGARPDDPRVRAAIDRVRDGVTWRYFDDRPFFAGEEEECVNGGVLALATYFGQLDEGTDAIVRRLLGERLPDGGWNCEPADESQRSSFDSTLCVLEGLLAVERDGSSAVPAAEIAEARRGGEEYLLERHLFRRRSTGEVVKDRYLNFTFPPYWFYDVLRALDYFRDVGGTPDPRLDEPLELLRSRRGDDGRWLAGRPWPRQVYFAVDAPEGEPSHWNTLRALRVLRWADAAADVTA